MNIELKKWSECALSELLRVCNGINRRYLSERLPYPYTEEDGKWWLNNVVLPHHDVDGLFFAVIYDGEVVGNITIEPKSDIYRKDAELGYFILPEYNGRGIATEAARQIISLAFDRLDIVRISSMVFSENIASQRVLLKNGFVIDGTMRSGAYKDGELHDIVHFGLLKSRPY